MSLYRIGISNFVSLFFLVTMIVVPPIITMIQRYHDKLCHLASGKMKIFGSDLEVDEGGDSALFLAVR